MQVNAGQLVNDGQQRKGVKVKSGQQGMGKKDTGDTGDEADKVWIQLYCSISLSCNL